MSNVGFRIFRRINRPDPGLVRALAVIPVANIADEMNRLFCLDAAIRPWNRALMAGCAFTVRARPGCNLLVHKALDMAAPGDVVIVEDGGDLTTALAGENMVLWARKRGLAGLVIDGAMRDVDAIRELDFPVYARGATLAARIATDRARSTCRSPAAVSSSIPAISCSAMATAS